MGDGSVRSVGTQPVAIVLAGGVDAMNSGSGRSRQRALSDLQARVQGFPKMSGLSKQFFRPALGQVLGPRVYSQHRFDRAQPVREAAGAASLVPSKPNTARYSQSLEKY